MRKFVIRQNELSISTDDEGFYNQDISCQMSKSQSKRVWNHENSKKENKSKVAYRMMILTHTLRK